MNDLPQKPQLNIGAVINSPYRIYKYKGVYFKKLAKFDYCIATNHHSNGFLCQSNLKSIRECKAYINYLLIDLKKDKNKLSKISKEYAEW